MLREYDQRGFSLGLERALMICLEHGSTEILSAVSFWENNLEQSFVCGLRVNTLWVTTRIRDFFIFYLAIRTSFSKLILFYWVVKVHCVIKQKPDVILACGGS